MPTYRGKKSTLKWDAPRLSNRLYRSLVNTTKDATGVIAIKARSFAPRGATGTLKASISDRVYKDRRSGRVVGQVGVVKGGMLSGSRAPADSYAPRVHFGYTGIDQMGRTPIQRPQPFIYKALGDGTKYLRKYEARLRVLLNK